MLFECRRGDSAGRPNFRPIHLAPNRFRPTTFCPTRKIRARKYLPSLQKCSQITRRILFACLFLRQTQRNLIKSNPNQIVFIIFRLIWNSTLDKLHEIMRLSESYWAQVKPPWNPSDIMPRDASISDSFPSLLFLYSQRSWFLFPVNMILFDVVF